jgi:excisionase family DNA binding protein
MSAVMTMGEAAKALGVSRPTMTNLVARGELTAHRSPLDRRARLIPVNEVLALKARAFSPIGNQEAAVAA